MDRRRFLKSAALGGSISAFLGLTPFNPLINRTRDISETQSPDSTLPGRASEPGTPTEPAAPAHRMWKTEFRGDIHGITTSDDSTELYIAISNSISRLNAATGELAWEAESEQSIRQPVVLSEEKTIATGRAGRVLAVNRQNGNRDWFENTDSVDHIGLEEASAWRRCANNPSRQRARGRAPA